MIVATAGHIDHGKTTLVRALTGVDTDRLPEEKARGISIDLGFAYWKTGTGEILGFVDVPGHERFIRNMLAGVCGIDYVMLVVAADDGVMPQTIEHLHIVDLLHVTRGAAVITKTDRVSAERVNEIIVSMRNLLAPTSLAPIPIIAVSAVTGDGIAALRDELFAVAKAHARNEHENRNFRYAIDRAFTMSGSGTVVTGTIFNGVVAVGDKLMLSPSGIEVRVRALQQGGQPVRRAIAGERCALNLTGANLDHVGRGDWVVAPALHSPTHRIDVRLRALASESQPIKHWTPVHLHLGTAAITARIAIRGGDAVAPGASALAQVVLDRPLAALHGDRFIIRDQSATRTIGGGIVLDPVAQATRRGSVARGAKLVALEQTTPDAALVDLLECTPSGVDLSWFQRVFNLTAEGVEAITSRCGATITGKDPRVAMPQIKVEAIRRHVLEALARFHHDSPQALGAEIEAVRKTLAPDLGMSTFVVLLRDLADQRKIEMTGSMIRLPQHVATANAADEKIWATVKPILDAAGFKVPPLRELAVSMQLKEEVLRDFLYRKSRTGDVIRVATERFYPRSTLAQLAAIAQSVARAAPGGKFTPAQFRDRSGIGRSLAMEILDSFDRLAITQRIGDVRKMRKDFVPILGAAIDPPMHTTVALKAAPPL